MRCQAERAYLFYHLRSTVCGCASSAALAALSVMHLRRARPAKRKAAAAEEGCSPQGEHKQEPTLKANKQEPTLTRARTCSAPEMVAASVSPRAISAPHCSPEQGVNRGEGVNRARCEQSDQRAPLLTALQRAAVDRRHLNKV